MARLSHTIEVFCKECASVTITKMIKEHNSISLTLTLFPHLDRLGYTWTLEKTR
jgi:hypothetical protein